ncbi:hypothetical protein E0F15_20585 [Frankia sp. B2]|uniref:hypothetical protein n=1 Tax=Frankia sp. B2 TaxID=2541730 RepID=UPI00106BFC9C|nr:hypothetical protein [Frankia sp. B2]TFE25056.1 hypothetical protein E0F15_20585 [Frankia sp. B2]
MPPTPQTGWVPDLTDFPPYPDVPFALPPSREQASPAGPDLILDNVIATLIGQGGRVPPIAWLPGSSTASDLTWWGRATRLKIGVHASVDDAAGEIVRACRGYETRDRVGWLMAASTYPVALLVLAPLRHLRIIDPWPALGIFVSLVAIACVLARTHSRHLDRRVAAEVLRLVPIRQPGDRRGAHLLDAASIDAVHRL